MIPFREISNCVERIPVKDVVCQELYTARNVVWGNVCSCLEEKAQGNYCTVWHMIVTGRAHKISLVSIIKAGNISTCWL